MKVVVKKLSETSFTYEDILRLIHKSFEERLVQGLKFTCSYLTMDEYENKTKGGEVFVAYDTDTGLLVGTVVATQCTDTDGIIFAYYQYLAIAPEYKHRGIGTMLFIYIEREACRFGAQYVISDTAVGAKSSVRFHIKQGFHIVGYRSFRSTNYYSYIFRKQLVPSKKWNNPIVYNMLFLKSYVKTRLKYKIHSRPTFIYKLYLEIVRK